MDKTKRNLVIVESPNKVKSLLKILKDAGYTKTIVMASVGHISEIKDKKDSYWNTGIYPDKKFKTDFAVDSSKKETVDKLIEQVKLSDFVYIASDPDREGESIAWSLKKFLKIPEEKYERVTFHEITPKAVLKAFDSPRKIDESLVDASHSRQILDKIVGYRLSPIARKKVFAKSVGRCQSAGLKLLVAREEEIQEFKPETYFDLFLHFEKNKQEFKAKYSNKIPTMKDVESVVSDCKGGNYIISDVSTKEKLSNPKPPFTTSTFQQEVSNKLGIGVKDAMSYAQKLFEGLDVGGQHIGLVTYLRTDSTDFAPEFLPVLEDFVKSNYGNSYYAPVKKAKKNENAQDGHECFRVVDLEMTPEKLSEYIHDERLLRVYTIIYKRTLQCAFKPSITSETTYTILNGKHMFTLVSNELKFDGYKKVYGAFEDKDGEVVKETFEKDEVLKKTSLEAIEQQTKPKPRFKEATFIKELESKGIGRPSTFATIVETLLSESRGYCKVEDKCMVPTDKGIKLSHFLDESFGDIININYTAEMEKDLDLIANNKLDMLDFLSSFHSKLEESASKAYPQITATVETDKVCPECGKPLVVRNGKFGQFLGCSGYPKCKHIEKLNKDS